MLVPSRHFHVPYFQIFSLLLIIAITRYCPLCQPIIFCVSLSRDAINLLVVKITQKYLTNFDYYSEDKFLTLLHYFNLVISNITLMI